jgi:hypothetical protein
MREFLKQAIQLEEKQRSLKIIPSKMDMDSNAFMDLASDRSAEPVDPCQLPDQGPILRKGVGGKARKGDIEIMKRQYLWGGVGCG